MANLPQSAAAAPDLNNGSDNPPLASQIRELQEECARLGKKLALVEAERNLYCKAVHSDPRGVELLANLDITDFEKCSAGLVESLD
jgi:hypothetical protein